jgi:potassium efflux system protein
MTEDGAIVQEKRDVRSLRAPMLRLVPILFASLAALGQGHAQPEPPREGGGAVEWIRPAEVPVRADALRRRLEAIEPDAEAQAALQRIERRLEQLSPDIDAGLAQANSALARSASFLELEDLQSQLTAAAAPLGAWETALAAEAKRVEAVIEDVARARRIWSQTRGRPETIAAGPLVEQRVQSALDALDKAAASLRAWRASVLAVSDRLVDLRAAVDATLQRLHASAARERMNFFVPSRAPLWQIPFGSQLRSQLPHIPKEFLVYARGTWAYVERDPRPLVVQALLVALLILAFRALSARSRQRLAGAAELPGALAHPYAVALLLALLASPWLHPLAPRSFMQLMATIALLPAARIVMPVAQYLNVTTVAGLFVLLLLDRTTLALTLLPAVARVSFLLTLVIAFGLALQLARSVRRAGNPPWLRRALRLTLVGLGLAFAAGLGGWANLGVLLGRGIIAGAVVALYVYAAMIALEPVLVYALTSAMLRRSHLFGRNTAVLQRRVERGLRWIGGVLWVCLVLRAVALSSTVADALRGLLQAGVSVGTLSISVGSVLAFLLTLLVALLLARIVNGVLEEDVYPRISLPRGIPYALSSLVRYGVYSLGFLFALAAAGVQLGQLAILLGGFGVGVGLGLQDLVKNFAAGLTLLIERRVHVGDALQIPSQEIFGRVLSIGMRATVIRSWDGSEVVVPNADLISGAVTNWTLSDRLCRIEVPVGVAYGTDPERVVALLLEAARSNDGVLPAPNPQALFKGFGDSSLDFVLRAWTDEQYERILPLTSELTLAIHRHLAGAGITIPFPQRDLHLVSVASEVRAALNGVGLDGEPGRTKVSK